MNPTIALMGSLAVFGGVGFYLGGAALGGSVLGLVLAIALVLRYMGTFRKQA